jgi:hypothetical protein
VHLRANYRVLAAEALNSVVRLGALTPGEDIPTRAAATARRLLAAERRDAGLEPPDPSLPAADVAAGKIADELRKHDDCSTLPAP